MKEKNAGEREEWQVERENSLSPDEKERGRTTDFLHRRTHWQRGRGGTHGREGRKSRNSKARLYSDLSGGKKRSQKSIPLVSAGLRGRTMSPLPEIEEGERGRNFIVGDMSMAPSLRTEKKKRTRSRQRSLESALPGA